MASSLWGMTQPGILVAVPSVLSPEPPSTDPPQESLAHSALPLLEFRVSSCKRNFVHWPFKRLSASPAVSPWQIVTRCFWQLVTFWLWCCTLGRPSWGLGPTLLRGNSMAAEISLQNFSCHLWEPNPSTPPLHCLPVWFRWSGFFCLSLVTRLLCSQCSVGYSGWFLYNLVVIPNWSLEEVSVAYTYSFAILNPQCTISMHSYQNNAIENSGILEMVPACNLLSICFFVVIFLSCQLLSFQ